MKLPKQFGGGGFQGMMAKAQDAMARAKNIEDELADERIEIDKGFHQGRCAWHTRMARHA